MERFGVLGLSYGKFDDGELIPAQSRHGVAIAHASLQPGRDGLQQSVTDLMPSVSFTGLKWSRSR